MAADFSLPMLQFGDISASGTRRRKRCRRMRPCLPFVDESFEAVTIGFGIRNVADRDKAFREMARVLKPGGRVVCLEFSSAAAGSVSVRIRAARPPCHAARRRGDQRPAGCVCVPAGVGRAVRQPRRAGEQNVRGGAIAGTLGQLDVWTGLRSCGSQAALGGFRMDEYDGSFCCCSA